MFWGASIHLYMLLKYKELKMSFKTSKLEHHTYWTHELVVQQALDGLSNVLERLKSPLDDL